MDDGMLKRVKRKLGVFDCLMLVFLLFNLVIRFGTIFYYPPYNGMIGLLIGGVVLACLCVIFLPKYLKFFLSVFGFSFFLFGFGAIDIQSRIFELIVSLVATALSVMNLRSPKTHGLNRHLVILILCYVGLSLFSLLLLPVTQIFRDSWFFGFPNFFFYLFIGPPYGFYYPLSAVIRLILFVVLAVQIAMSAEARDNYRWLFSGIFSGAVFCALIGLLDFYGVISLKWYRFGKTAVPGALHSTFGNRGWFGEFILISVPFVLIGFMSKTRGIWWRVLLFASLVLCEIALLLAGGRAGWVSYPLILFVCWLFFWFTKEGRLASFRLSWKDLMKVGISVPITIVISFIIVFQVLMPLSDYLRDQGDTKEPRKDSKQMTQYLKSRVVDLKRSDPGGRQYTWGQGFNVGSESPIFGVGYESFCWHANVLAPVSGSHFNTFYKGRIIHQTPHNIFFSIFSSGGAVGLYLWLVTIGYALVILTFDLIREKRLLNIPVIICILSFHIFGIFQSMQYIPMIWSVIFLCLGYAMTIDPEVLPGRLQRASGVLTKTSVVLLGIGIFFYVSNFESRNLAQKYDLRIYAMEQDRDRFAGFFQHSQRWQYGDYRWCGRKGAIYVPGGGAVELAFHCRTPEMEKEPVEVQVSHEGTVLDTIVFGGTSGERGAGSKGGSAKLKAESSKLKAESVKRSYVLPETPGQTQRLVIDVSRTWIPHNHLGNFDRRELGVGVKILNSR